MLGRLQMHPHTALTDLYSKETNMFPSIMCKICFKVCGALWWRISAIYVDLLLGWVCTCIMLGSYTPHFIGTSHFHSRNLSFHPFPSTYVPVSFRTLDTCGASATNLVLLCTISFTVFSYLCFISSTLRWDKSAAIQELFSFLGIGTKHIIIWISAWLCIILFNS